MLSHGQNGTRRLEEAEEHERREAAWQSYGGEVVSRLADKDFGVATGLQRFVSLLHVAQLRCHALTWVSIEITSYLPTVA